MKKLLPKTYRELDKRYKLKKRYIVKTKKTKNGDLIVPLPYDIIKAYHIEKGDIAIFEVAAKNRIIVRFVKKTMYGIVSGG